MQAVCIDMKKAVDLTRRSDDTFMCPACKQILDINCRPVPRDGLRHRRDA